MSIFEKDLRKYMDNFSDENFGNLEELNNKCNFSKEIFLFKNWNSNDSEEKGYCYAIIENKTIELELKEMILNKIYLTTAEEIFKFYYFLCSLEFFDYRLRDIFFENLTKIQIKKLLDDLISKINGSSFSKNRDDINILEFIKIGKNPSYNIVTVLNYFYNQEIFPIIYGLKDEFLFLYYSNDYSISNYFENLLEDSENIEKKIFILISFSSLHDVSILENNKAIIKKFIKNNWEKYGDLLLENIIPNEYCAKERSVFRNVFIEIIREFEQDNTEKYLENFHWSKDFEKIILLLNEDAINETEIVIPKIFEKEILKKFLNHFVKYKEKEFFLKNNLFSNNNFYSFNSTTQIFFSVIATGIFCNENNFNKWEKKMKNFVRDYQFLFFSDEYEILYPIIKIFSQIIILHMILIQNYKYISEDKFERIKRSLSLISEDILFYYLQNTVKINSTWDYEKEHGYEINVINNHFKYLINERTELLTYFNDFINKWKLYSPTPWSWQNDAIGK